MHLRQSMKRLVSGIATLTLLTTSLLIGTAPTPASAVALAPATTFKVVTDKATYQEGETVNVSVDMSNLHATSPEGLNYLTFAVAYDPNVLDETPFVSNNQYTAANWTPGDNFTDIVRYSMPTPHVGLYGQDYKAVYTSVYTNPLSPTNITSADQRIVSFKLAVKGGTTITNSSIQITALTAENEPDVWGTSDFTLVSAPIHIESLNSQAAQADYDSLGIFYQGTDNASSVTQDLILPNIAIAGSTFSWRSSDTHYISNSGKIVARPMEDRNIVMEATITNGSVTLVKPFTVTLKAQQSTITGISISRAEQTIYVTDTFYLPVASFLLQDGTTQATDAITWVQTGGTTLTRESSPVGYVVRPMEVGTYTFSTVNDFGVPNETFTLMVVPFPIVIPVIPTVPAVPTLSSLTATHQLITVNAGQTAPAVGITGIMTDHSTAPITSGIEWLSADPYVASVINGKITGISVGQTTVTASYLGKSVTLNVTVTENTPTHVVVTPAPAPTPAPTLSTSSPVVVTPSPTVTEEPKKDEPKKEEPKAEPPSGKDVFRSEVVKTDLNVVKVVETRIQQAKESSNNNAPAFKPTDTSSHWATKTIDTFTKLKAVQGFTDGTVKPDQEISRAEFVTILSRLFSVEGTKKVELKDVNKHWASDSINKFVAAGVVNGYGDGSFRPNQSISREEMVVILSRIVNMQAVTKDSSKGTFSDTAKSFAADAIKQAAEAGIISGKGDGNFAPKANSTRAEALQVILNTLNLNPDIKSLLQTLN